MDRSARRSEIAKRLSIFVVKVIQGTRFSHRPVPKGSHTPDHRWHPGFDVFERVNRLDDRGESLVRLVYRYALLGLYQSR